MNAPNYRPLLEATDFLALSPNECLHKFLLVATKPKVVLYGSQLSLKAEGYDFWLYFTGPLSLGNPTCNMVESISSY